MTDKALIIARVVVMVLPIVLSWKSLMRWVFRRPLVLHR